MQVDREQTFRSGEAVVVNDTTEFMHGRRGWVRELVNPREEGLHVDDWLPIYKLTLVGGSETMLGIDQLKPLEPMDTVYLDRGLTAIESVCQALEALSDLQGNAEGGPWEHEYELLEIALTAIGRKHQLHQQ